MIAIHSGIQLAAEQHLQADLPQPTKYIIACDSKTAIQAVSNPSRRRSGQQIIRAIHNLAHFYQESLDIQFQLQWIPSYSKIPGNDIADREAKQATRELRGHSFGSTVRAQRQATEQTILREWRKDWRSSTTGQHPRCVDSATPGPHVRNLYDNLPRGRANLLAQLRTGHCWLKSYRKKIGYIDDDKCDCGDAETVEHVLVECPLLRQLRATLQRKIGSKVKTMSAMLGGKPSAPPTRSANRPDTMNTPNKKEDWRITSAELNAVLDFAEESQRFMRKDADI